MTCHRSVKKRPSAEKRSLDNLWSGVVKLKAGGVCEFCGDDTYLNSHHIFSRSNHAVRWDIDNGICLCAKHHVLGNFSAHKSPMEFSEWLIEKRGDRWYESLKLRSKSPSKWKQQLSAVHDVLREVYNDLKNRQID